MASGTVTIHSWNDGAEDDEGDYAPIGSNYNCRLDVRDDYNAAANAHKRRMFGAREAETTTRTREHGGRGLRSNIVRPQRLGMDVEGDDGGDAGAGW